MACRDARIFVTIQMMAPCSSTQPFRNEHGATPLLYASVEGSVSVAGALIQAGCRTPPPPPPHPHPATVATF